jgi:DNA-binding response OmpR family regulator
MQAVGEAAKVLILDLDRVTAAAIDERLNRLGFKTQFTASGREGIQRFLEVTPQAIIVREALPGLDGRDTARRVREMSDLPIIFVSDRRDVFAKERALPIGDDYVTPPWNWGRLTAKLNALLRRRRDGHEASLLYDDGRLLVDFASRLVAKDGRTIHLTDTESRPIPNQRLP